MLWRRWLTPVWTNTVITSSLLTLMVLVTPKHAVQPAPVQRSPPGLAGWLAGCHRPMQVTLPVYVALVSRGKSPPQDNVPGFYTERKVELLLLNATMCSLFPQGKQKIVFFTSILD